jgi:hypothetical protein
MTDGEILSELDTLWHAVAEALKDYLKAPGGTLEGDVAACIKRYEDRLTALNLAMDRVRGWPRRD